MPTPPLVGIVMGSDSDLRLLEPAIEALAEFDIPFEVRVISAHRTPDIAHEYATTAASRGLRVIIGAAGAAAALPGVLAAATTLPVIGVPLARTSLNGMDALLSIVQMPPGIPVATVGIDGGRNAGLLAVRILASGDPVLTGRYAESQREMARKVRERDAAMQDRFPTA
jgi:5-(carboxyamino)imidazole ribonucleotide mutase